MATSYSNLGSTGFRIPIVGVASSVATCGNLGPAPRLVDGDMTADEHSIGYAFGTAPPLELKFDFRAIGPQIIDEYTWYQFAADPHGTWKIAGSNDDITYTDLDAGTALGGNTIQIVPFTNTDAYLYYKLIMIAGTAGDGCISGEPILEVEFKIEPGPEPDASETSYFHRGGMGNRASQISVSTTFTMLAGTVDALVNGRYNYSTSDNSSCKFDLFQSGKSITFDFGSRQKIDEASWWQNPGSELGSACQWEGSNNGTTWTAIGGPFAIGSGSGIYQEPQLLTQLHGNTASYRYYRISNMETSGTADPHVEIFFRLSPGTDGGTPTVENECGCPMWFAGF